MEYIQDCTSFSRYKTVCSFLNVGKYALAPHGVPLASGILVCKLQYVLVCHDVTEQIANPNCELTPGMKLIGKQACLSGRTPLVLAAGSITYQSKSSALETQVLPSHQPLQVSKECSGWTQSNNHVTDSGHDELGMCKASLVLPFHASACVLKQVKRSSTGRNPMYLLKPHKLESCCVIGIAKQAHRQQHKHCNGSVTLSIKIGFMCGPTPACRLCI